MGPSILQPDYLYLFYGFCGGDALESAKIEAGGFHSANPEAFALPLHSARLRILCAEDEAINRVIIEDMARSMGHSVEFAENGAVAIERLQREDFDLVLMDRRMPTMDGIEATRRIRNGQAQVRDPRIYIIACTANVSPSQQQECRSAGTDDFVAKPVEEMEFHAALDRAMVELRLRGRPLGKMRSSTGPATQPAGELPAGLSEAELLAILDEADAAPSARPDPESVRNEIARQYLLDAPARLSQMRSSVAAGDREGLGLAAHSLKNLSHYVAAPQLSAIAKRLEDLADTEPMPDLALILAEAERAYETVRERLGNLLEKPTTHETATR